MTHPKEGRRSRGFKLLAVALALVWAAADVASAGDGASSTRSGGSSSSASSSSSSSASSSSSGSSGGSSRSAVSRSGSSTSSDSRSAVSRGRSGRGAARTRSSGRRNDHRGDHRFHGGVRVGFGGSYYWNPFWGYWGYGYPGWGYYPPVVYSSRAEYGMGALDLEVRPKRAEVYVDGQYVGLARQYDGFPSHLWLESGVYEVSFYKPGYETQSRTVKILSGLILDVDIDLREGRAVKPEMRFEPAAYEDEPYRDEIGERIERRDRAEMQARLHVRVEPGSALVYLDGNVLGTADELAGLHAGLLLKAGPHRLEIVRRGFETVERELYVEPGEEIEVDLELRPLDRPSP